MRVDYKVHPGLMGLENGSPENMRTAHGFANLHVNLVSDGFSGCLGV